MDENNVTERKARLIKLELVALLCWRYDIGTLLSGAHLSWRANIGALFCYGAILSGSYVGALLSGAHLTGDHSI